MKESLHLPRQSHSIRLRQPYLWTCVDISSILWLSVGFKQWKKPGRTSRGGRGERSGSLYSLFPFYKDHSWLSPWESKSNQAALSMWFSMISGSDNYSIHPPSRSTGHERPLRSLALWIRCSLPTAMWLQPADDTHCLSSPFITRKRIFRDMRWLFQSHRGSNC